MKLYVLVICFTVVLTFFCSGTESLSNCTAGSDWTMAFTRTVPHSVRVDGVELCKGRGVEHGVTTAFCDLAYPPYMKKTLNFLHRAAMNITVVGDKNLPVTVT